MLRACLFLPLASHLLHGWRGDEVVVPMMIYFSLQELDEGEGGSRSSRSDYAMIGVIVDKQCILTPIIVNIALLGA